MVKQYDDGYIFVIIRFVFVCSFQVGIKNLKFHRFVSYEICTLLNLNSCADGMTGDCQGKKCVLHPIEVLRRHVFWCCSCVFPKMNECRTCTRPDTTIYSILYNEVNKIFFSIFIYYHSQILQLTILSKRDTLTNNSKTNYQDVCFLHVLKLVSSISKNFSKEKERLK